MSQHILTLQTPLGSVLVTAGYDQTLDEAFLNYIGHHDREFMSPSGTRVADLQQLAKEQLQTLLPQQVIDAIQDDVAAMRTGENINRRITYYDDELAAVPQGGAS